MKNSIAWVVALLLVGVLSACSGGDGGNEDDYCADAKKAAPTFKSLSDGDFAGAKDTFALSHQLADEAPDEVEKDWAKIDKVNTTVEKAFKEAGLKFEDLSRVEKGDIPKGVNASRLQSLAKEMSALSGTDFTNAAKRIDAHAKKVCDVTLHVGS